MSKKTLKVGIIGIGGIAKSHLRTYFMQPDVEIVAGADLVPGKAEAFFKSCCCFFLHAKKQRSL